MKKFFLLFILIFSPILAFSAQDFHISLEPHFGFSHGMIKELIYSTSYPHRLLSELDWDRNLFFYGANLDFSMWRLHILTDFSSSIHKNFGEMTDSDWMNDSNTQMKTTYSVGTDESVENYEGKLSLYFDFFPFNSQEEKKFIVSPSAHFYYQYDSFSRTDAEGWYGQSGYSSDGKHHWWFEDEAKHFPTEYYWSESKGRWVRQKLAGVDYERTFFCIFLGPKISFSLSKKISLGFEFLIAPFTLAIAHDTHHGTNPWTDSQRQKSYWNTTKIALGGEFLISERFSATLGTEFLVFKLKKGKGEREGSKTMPASSQFSMSAKLGLKMKIL